MGRVTPVAESLGISLDEVLGAMAVLTISGVKEAEALTQIRGFMTAMQKPTDAMTAALRKMGFESATTAVRTLGLAQFMKELVDATDGTNEALNKVVPRVRGLNFLVMAGKQRNDAFAQSIREIEAAGAELLDEKFDIVFETNAAQVMRELNKLKVFMTEDIGGAIVAMGRKFFEVFSADQIADATRLAGPGFVKMGLSLGLIAGQIAVSTMI
jgi:TP901 family phage tail tape measure protein